MSLGSRLLNFMNYLVMSTFWSLGERMFFVEYVGGVSSPAIHLFTYADLAEDVICHISTRWHLGSASFRSATPSGYRRPVLVVLYFPNILKKRRDEKVETV